VKPTTAQSSEAIKVIANAASEAAKVIANSAAEAVKTINIKSNTDHDLLTELKVRMEGLKSDIKDLKDGTSTKINDHEIRLTALESSKTKQNTMMSIGIGILTLLTSLIVWHVAGR
jgi:hypothetical protein